MKKFLLVGCLYIFFILIPSSTQAAGGQNSGDRCGDQGIFGYWDRCESTKNLACTDYGTSGAGTCVQCGVTGNPCCIGYQCGGTDVCTDNPPSQVATCKAIDISCKRVGSGIPITCPADVPEVCKDSSGSKTNLCCQAGKCPALIYGKKLPAGDPTCLGGKGIKTALGCLDITGIPTITTILNWATGIAGGIAFLMILFAAFQITTAAGDAKRVQAGKELLVAALSGLFLISLSVVVLNFLGVNVLGLQNLGFTTP